MKIISTFLIFFFALRISANEKILIKKDNDIFFFVEFANTKEKMKKGLMNRKNINEINGMLFLNKRPRVMKMWMKDTHHDLKVIFIDELKKIISIKEGKKYSENIISSRVPVLAVLEIVKSCKNLNFKLGDEISWEFADLNKFDSFKEKLIFCQK
ncbi:MAG: hypothetical protein CMP25_01835 [Rickettsiales bacterium]|nr:hypothetical protein [Rickettsiales bacterium]